MSWNQAESRRRVQEHLDSMGEIEIGEVVRPIDLDSLSETRCRRFFGAHTYAEVRNLASLVATMTDKRDRQEIIQAVHIWQREVARIVEAADSERINFQGVRVHALTYTPINDAAEIAATAALIQLMIDRYGIVFSDEFPALPDLAVRSGSDIGYSIGTKNGMDGDRELLFLGAAANHAAKQLATGHDRRLSIEMARALPADWSDLVIAEDAAAGGYYLARPSEARLEEMLAEHAIDWSPADARERLAEDKRLFPVEKAGLYATDAKVDFDSLSYSDSKLIEGATLYGDVSGFTKYIDQQTTDEDRRAALRAFHAIRKEMARVVRRDYGGVRVQFQGDRVQGLFSVPADDADGFSTEAVNAGIGLQSSFELVLKDLLPEISPLGLAVGISQGTTIASKLGERGHRDRICLGLDVLRAEHNEEHCEKWEIGISDNVRAHLDPALAERFIWRAQAGCFVAGGLDAGKAELARAARDYAAGVAPTIISQGRGPVVSTGNPGEGRTVTPSSSWAKE